MAREKSEFLGAFGIAFRIFMAIVNAVLRAGGNDQIVRLAEKPEVADKLATILMAEAGIEAQKPQPDTTGLEVFEIEVDGDDPRWCEIDSESYAYCDSDACADDFPPKQGGLQIIRYVLLAFGHEPTTQEFIDEVARRNLSRPDRAVTETILDKMMEESDCPVVGICGVIEATPDDDSIVGCIYGKGSSRDIAKEKTNSVWSQNCRFVAVVSLREHSRS